MLFSEAKITNFIIHSIEERYGDKEVLLSQHEINLETELTEVLKTYFFKKFERPSSLFKFSHEEDLAQNEVFSFSQMIFGDEADFLEVSQAITNFLYTKSTSNTIKTGEVYVLKIEGILFEDQKVNGVGIFKSENKDIFLKVFPEENGIAIGTDQGININKLDKGAIILDLDAENGFVVGVVDNTNKQDQAKYWKDDFLNVDLREDSYNYTQQYIDAVRGFASQMEEADKLDKADFVQRSFEYLKENDEFNKSDFQEIVLQSHENIEGFDEYMTKIPEEYRFEEAPEDFQISKPALKSNNRYIRSVIKLDKNFHLYVHGKRDWVERGRDDGRNLFYYKVYFENES